jgi:mannitol-1-phosphate 5-dehydrogenase
VRAVVVGAGRVGCGVLGDLLRQQGHEVVFVARDERLVEHLDRTGRYVVRCVRGAARVDRLVRGVRAVPITDAAAVRQAVREADLVATAVGLANLAAVAGVLAPALAAREAPVNVVAFENGADPGLVLRTEIARCWPGGSGSQRHGYAGGLVLRIVAARLGGPGDRQPLMFVADSERRIVVDGTPLRAPLPVLDGVRVTDQYAAAVHRKLFTLNAAHATAAYLGMLKGYRHVHAAVRDGEIRAAVLGVVREARLGLVARYGAAAAGGPDEPARVLARLANAGLDDQVRRVGRDPLRKLAAGERLVGAIALVRSAGVQPGALAVACAAALHAARPVDPHRRDHDRLLREVCRLDPGAGIGARIADLARQLDRATATGAVPHSLAAAGVRPHRPPRPGRRWAAVGPPDRTPATALP